MNTGLHTSKPKVLFVDDEIRLVRSLKVLFSTQNKFVVFTATSGQQALDIVKNDSIHVIVSDQRMPEITGVSLLKQVRDISPNTVGILLTGYADIDAIVGSINEGEVFRYITKPWQNQQLKEIVFSAIEIAEKLYASSALRNLNEMSNIRNTEIKQRILVLHPENDKSLALLINQLFDQQHSIYSANNFETALNILTKGEFSVIVTDIGYNDQISTTLIKLLKKAYPMALTVVVTDSADANVAISLINQGQVYRYIPKPVKAGRLKLGISSALNYYNSCKNAPVLLQRHSVDKFETSEIKNVTSNFMERIKLIKKRLFFSNQTKQ